MRLAFRRSALIHSGWLVRILAGSTRFHDCVGCGSRMFVKAPSGLCPVCFTRRREREANLHEIVYAEAGAALQDWITYA